MDFSKKLMVLSVSMLSTLVNAGPPSDLIIQHLDVFAFSYKNAPVGNYKTPLEQNSVFQKHQKLFPRNDEKVYKSFFSWGEHLNSTDCQQYQRILGGNFPFGLIASLTGVNCNSVSHIVDYKTPTTIRDFNKKNIKEKNSPALQVDNLNLWEMDERTKLNVVYLPKMMSEREFPSREMWFSCSGNACDFLVMTREMSLKFTEENPDVKSTNSMLDDMITTRELSILPSYTEEKGGKQGSITIYVSVYDERLLNGDPNAFSAPDFVKNGINEFIRPTNVNFIDCEGPISVDEITKCEDAPMPSDPYISPLTRTTTTVIDTRTIWEKMKSGFRNKAWLTTDL